MYFDFGTFPTLVHPIRVPDFRETNVTGWNQIYTIKMLSKTASVLAAGAGLCFVGYCIYFDHKRRSDPLFKQKLRESK